MARQLRGVVFDDIYREGCTAFLVNPEYGAHEDLPDRHRRAELLLIVGYHLRANFTATQLILEVVDGTEASRYY